MQYYDVDWLRAIVILLLILYYVTVSFQPWGHDAGFITHSESMEGLWVGTFAISFLLYEVIRRIKWLRPFFGMKFNTDKRKGH